MPLARVRVSWSGWSGGPGVSTLYFSVDEGAAPDLTALSAMFFAFRPYLPPVISVQVENSGDVIDPINGDLLGSWSTSTQPITTGTGTGPFIATTGAQIRWETGVVHGNRRLRGRTFLVPMVTTAFGNDGWLLPTAVTALSEPADTLVSDSNSILSVWGRPTDTLPGVAASATDAVVPNKPVVLTSRRD